MPEVLVLLIPIFAILMIFGIPIVALLTGHQRKMAELYHKGVPDSQVVHELQALRADVAELRDRVNQQMLMIDRPGSVQPPGLGQTDPDVRSRLHNQ